MNRFPMIQTALTRAATQAMSVAQLSIVFLGTFTVIHLTLTGQWFGEIPDAVLVEYSAVLFYVTLIATGSVFTITAPLYFIAELRQKASPTEVSQ